MSTRTELDDILSTDAANASTGELRSRIDGIDELIASALVARSELSHAVQHARVESGGPRIDLTRERQIYANFKRLLGDGSGAVAEAVLQYCRGRV